MDRENANKKFGERIQRCYGCFVAFYLKDMWLGPDGTFYCASCKSDDMFHFDDYSTRFDLSRLPSLKKDS